VAGLICDGEDADEAGGDFLGGDIRSKISRRSARVEDGRDRRSELVPTWARSPDSTSDSSVTTLPSFECVHFVSKTGKRDIRWNMKKAPEWRDSGASSGSGT
jgi:hypothetical protein